MLADKRAWVLALLSVLLMPFHAWAQETHADKHNDVAPAAAVTLSMNWKRGDRYSPNFIELYTPCQNSTDGRCECFTDFAVTKSQEFADYIASFGAGKVPAIYEVRYGADGQLRRAILVRVGSWPGEKFHPNERLIGTRVLFRNGKPGHTQSAKIHNPADCFPPTTSDDPPPNP